MCIENVACHKRNVSPTGSLRLSNYTWESQWPGDIMSLCLCGMNSFIV